MKAATLLLLLACTQAFAQTQQPEQTQAPAEKPAAQPSAAAGGSALFRYDESEARRLFRELDRNGDGYLSADELAAERSNQGNWAAVDRNGDGRISPSEFTTIRKP